MDPTPKSVLGLERATSSFPMGRHWWPQPWPCPSTLQDGNKQVSATRELHGQMQTERLQHGVCVKRQDG